MTTWSQAFHRFQPALWEDNAGSRLAYPELPRFTRRLADSSRVPDLDPPLYGDEARYLAEAYEYLR